MMKSIPKAIFVLKNSLRSGLFNTNINRFSTQDISGKNKCVESLFINPEVQKILKSITGRDYEKLFAPRVKSSNLQNTSYEFVTEKMLKELQAKAAAKATRKLQMPPVMNIRKETNEVLSKDPELQGYLKHPTVFIDISSNISSRDRVMTVREVDGTLRKATGEERIRMNQIFFPIPGRNIENPKMFESPHLQRLLEEQKYEFVLDCACVQFEPDSPEYHQVTSETYEDIKHKNAFDSLRSTRHFGPMAFYFALQTIDAIDELLLDMIRRNLIKDASDTIRLLYIINPEITSIKITNEIDIIQDYIKSHSTNKAELELAFQAFLEQQSNNIKEEAQA